jgi:iduronate 2-sulfatase
MPPVPTALLLVVLFAGANVLRAARPNVLFIAVDDLRPQLGCYGDPVAITPNLDGLAARGTLFRRAFCQQAVCNASRQSLLSGRRPDSIRVWDLKTVFRDTAPDVVSLPEYFKQQGYFAQSFGKIYHDGLPDPQSWSVPAQFEVMPKREDYRLPENRAPHKGGKAAATEFVDAPEDAYPDGKVASGAVAALEQLSRDPAHQPFFLAVGIRKPHLPFTAPKKYWDLYATRKIPSVEQPEPPAGAPDIALHNSEELRGYSDQPDIGPWSPDQIETLRRGYYAAASFADAEIGRVLEALKRTGLEKNTIVVVWGDHGYHLGEFGLWAKTTNYEADTRVPLIVSTPDDRPRGVRTNAIVELLDLYPTLVELCGLPPKDKIEGRSFAANLGHAASPGRPVAFSQFPRPWAGGRKISYPHYMGYAVRDANYRYVEWRDFSTAKVVARELYAYAGDDMFEHINLAGDPAQRLTLDRLAALLPGSPSPLAR